MNQVQGELGIPQSSTVVGNTDPSTLQLFNLLIGLTTELRRMKRWTACQWETVLEVQPAIQLSGNFTASSPTVTNISQVSGTGTGTSGLSPFLFQVNAPSVPTSARILSVDSTTQITLNMDSTTTTTGGSFTAAQDTWPIPADFDFYTNRAFWDRTNRWELLGPDSPQMDQWHQSGIVVTGPRRHFRKWGPFISGGVFKIWPPPFELTTVLQLASEYSSNLCVAVKGNFALPTVGGGSYVDPSNFSSTWANDTDQPILDDDLLLKGLKWKYWETKGFNYVTAYNNWLDYVDQQWARDGARGTLSMTKRVHPIFISPANVQDGFFPGPVGPNSM